jgi:hypothetical protein
MEIQTTTDTINREKNRGELYPLRFFSGFSVTIIRHGYHYQTVHDLPNPVSLCRFTPFPQPAPAGGPAEGAVLPVAGPQAEMQLLERALQ